MSTENNVILARVTLEVVIHNGKATEKEITDWLRFYLGKSGSLANSNPLADQEPDALPESLRWDVVCAGIKNLKKEKHVQYY